MKIVAIFMTVISVVVVLAVSIVKFSMIASDISRTNEDDDSLTNTFRK